VAEFLKDRIGFLDMSEIVEKCLQSVPFVRAPNYEDYVNTDKEARIRANELVKKLQVYSR
jgi:1-deoxy-D-xylulose-5-phosphate reductoisomerase